MTGRLLGVFQKHDLSDDHVWLLPTEHDMSCFLAAPLASPSGRWGQTLCPIDAQTAILIGGQGARMQFCKDPMWKLCTGQSVQQHFRLVDTTAQVRAVFKGTFCVQQRTCPGWPRRLWLRVRLLRPGSATQPSTTPTQEGSLCSGALKTRSGSMTCTSWTRRAGSGPW